MTGRWNGKKKMKNEKCIRCKNAIMETYKLISIAEFRIHFQTVFDASYFKQSHQLVCLDSDWQKQLYTQIGVNRQLKLYWGQKTILYLNSSLNTVKGFKTLWKAWSIVLLRCFLRRVLEYWNRAFKLFSYKTE